jgi:hypothetical protein
MALEMYRIRFAAIFDVSFSLEMRSESLEETPQSVTDQT